MIVPFGRRFRLEAGPYGSWHNGIKLNPELPPNRFVVPEFPLADHRDMVFMDNISLKQVATKELLADDKFCVELEEGSVPSNVKSTLYVGRNPNGKMVEATVLENGFKASLPNGLVIRGLGFTHYGKAPLNSTSQNLVLENNTSTWNGWYGLSLVNCRDSKVIGNTVAYNGLIGMRCSGVHRILAEGNTVRFNTWERFNAAWAASGMKVIVTLRGKIKQNKFENNFGPGLWLDIGCDSMSVVKNYSADNNSFGIYSEHCHRIKVAANTLYSNGTGIGLAGSTYNNVSFNTFVDNNVALNIRDDGRLATDLKPGDFEYAYIIGNATTVGRITTGLTYITKGNVVSNNIYSSSGNTTLFRADQNTVAKNPARYARSADFVDYVNFNAYYLGVATPTKMITWRLTPTGDEASITTYNSLPTFKTQTGFETTSVGANGPGVHPYFTDAAAGDYSLKPTAPVELRTKRVLGDSIADALEVPRGTRWHMGAIQGGAGKEAQTITFNVLPDKTYGDASFDLTATATSGLPVSFSVLSGPAVLSGNTLSLTGAGEVTIRASQEGNDDFTAASVVDRSFTAAKASQTLSFGEIPNKIFGDVPFILTASASSGLPVNLNIVSGPATLSENTVTLTGAGTVTIEASQPGNGNYLAATPVAQSFTVNKAAQTIAFAPFTDPNYVIGQSLALEASASSGLPVSYSVAGPASISGTTLTITAAGTVTVTALQSGNANYLAATPLQQSLTAAAAPANGTGLSARYFNNVDFTGSSITRTDATVNFDWGRTAPAAAIGADTYSVRWTGQVMPQYSQTYTFYTLSDDGVRVWVDGVQLIDNWTNHAPTENSGTISLVAGQKYTIKVEYYENLYGAVCKLFWSSPSQPKQIIPQNRLFPTPTGTATTTRTTLQGADDPTKSLSVNVFPNPVTDLLRVGFGSEKEGTVRVSLTNALGQPVRQWEQAIVAGANHLALRVSGLSNGVYFLTIRKEGRQKIERVVIAH